MNDVLESAIKKLAEKAGSEQNGPNALHFSQAALNLAQSMQVIASVKRGA